MSHLTIGLLERMIQGCKYLFQFSTGICKFCPSRFLNTSPRPQALAGQLISFYCLSDLLTSLPESKHRLRTVGLKSGTYKCKSGYREKPLMLLSAHQFPYPATRRSV